MKRYDDEAIQDPERVLAEVAHTDLVLADVNHKIMPSGVRPAIKRFWGQLYGGWLHFRSENPLISNPRARMDPKFVEATFQRSQDFRMRGLKLYDAWKTEMANAAAVAQRERVEGEARERAGGLHLGEEARKAAQGPKGPITTSRVFKWTLGIAAALGGVFVGQRIWKGVKESEEEKRALRKAEREQKRAERLGQLRVLAGGAESRLVPEVPRLSSAYAAATHEYGPGNGHLPPPGAFAMLGTGSSDLEAMNRPPPAPPYQLGPYEQPRPRPTYPEAEDETMPPVPGPY